MINKGIFTLVLITGFNFTGFAQASTPKSSEKSKIDAINTYVDFVNQSIHGLFIVNRLLIDQNHELNKYVDLETEKMNNFTGVEFSDNIFNNSEFYTTSPSPVKLYDEGKKLLLLFEGAEKSELTLHLDALHKIILSVNALRFDIDKLIKGLPTDQKLISNVYAKLEECVKLHDDFYKSQEQLEALLDKLEAKYVNKNAPYYPNYTAIRNFVKSGQLICDKIKSKDTDLLSQILVSHKNNYEKYKAIHVEDFSSVPTVKAELKSEYSKTLSSADQLTKLANAFMQNESIPSKYKLYGRNYYYYNIELLSTINEVGPGLIFTINRIIKRGSLPLVKFMEIPPVFKIIYPKKIVPQETIKATSQVVSIPTEVKERKVSKNKAIRVDSDVVELQFYDHLIADGDIVSINFNGDWILEKEELEKGSKKVKLQLNKSGKNFLLLHADNVGKRPPNTMAFSYYFGGEKKEVVMKSDNNTSELIEILLSNQ